MAWQQTWQQTWQSILSARPAQASPGHGWRGAGSIPFSSVSHSTGINTLSNFKCLHCTREIPCLQMLIVRRRQRPLLAIWRPGFEGHFFFLIMAFAWTLLHDRLQAPSKNLRLHSSYDPSTKWLNAQKEGQPLHTRPMSKEMQPWWYKRAARLERWSNLGSSLLLAGFQFRSS